VAGIVLSSYALVAVGAVLTTVGYVARRRGHRYGRPLLVAGGTLVLAGVVGLGYFVSAFG
jgi:hypothetical protein